MNQIMLIGNVTGDVNLVTTPGGVKVANFSIAVTKYKDKNTGKWLADYFDCVAWKSLAVNISKSIKKGTRVILSGRIENQNWEDSDGERRKNTRVTVKNLGVELSFAVCTGIKKSRKVKEEVEDFDDDNDDADLSDEKVNRYGG